MMSLFVNMNPKDRPTGETCLEDPYFHGLREEMIVMVIVIAIVMVDAMIHALVLVVAIAVIEDMDMVAIADMVAEEIVIAMIVIVIVGTIVRTGEGNEIVVILGIGKEEIVIGILARTVIEMMIVGAPEAQGIKVIVIGITTVEAIDPLLRHPLPYPIDLVQEHVSARKILGKILEKEVKNQLVFPY